MSSPVRLLIVCNIRLHCQCLADALLRQGFVPSVGFYLDAVEAFEYIKKTRTPPEVMLVDWHLPNGGAIDLARWVKTQSSPIRIFLFGLADAAQGEWAREIVHGANYILQTDSFDELLARLSQLNPKEPANLHGCTSAPNGEANGNNDWSPQSLLTVREQQIVHLIEQGLSNKEIAKRLFLSLHTVKNHIHNLISKLEVESRHEAVRALKIRVPFVNKRTNTDGVDVAVN
jgi:DNA-binding NarL/FixJ family response regulator